MWYDYKTELSEKELLGEFRSYPAYREDAKMWRDEIDFYERKLTIAPFYGAGAGIVAISVAIMSNPNSSFISVILPSAWLFVLSLSFMFVAGGLYLTSSVTYENELTIRGNAVQEFCSFKDALRKAESNLDKLELERRSRNIKPILKSVNDKIAKANDASKKGDKFLLFARLFSIFGVVLLLLAIISPLVVISLSYNFGFI
jgi:hypothetical protein